MKFINVPGLRNSGPQHWQSEWEKTNPTKFIRVQQENWEAPNKELWVKALLELIETIHEPVVLTGHSVGCATIVHAAAQQGEKILGALLVAPSDVESENYPTYITGFSPLPLRKLPFLSTVVASTNDHVVTLERARYFSEKWGSEFFTIQDAGHLEDLGPWTKGQEIFSNLVNTIENSIKGLV